MSGAVDMEGGVAISVVCIKSLLETLHAPLRGGGRGLHLGAAGWGLRYDDGEEVDLTRGDGWVAKTIEEDRGTN